MSQTDPRPDRDLPLTPAYDEERIASTWQRIVARREQRAGRRRATPYVLMAAMAAAAVVAVALLGPRLGSDVAPRVAGPLQLPASPAALEVGGVIEARSSDLVFDDGSRVAMAPRSRLQVLANDGAQIAMLLDGGPARFDVTPGGPRRWTIDTALASVEVVGTVFRVDPGPDRLVVEVERGIVFVRGDRVPGRVAKLTAGERIEVTARATETAAAPQLQPSPSPSPPPSQSPPPSPPPSPSPSPPPSPVLSPPPSSSPLPSLDDVLREADQLRRDGRAREAAALLERALDAEPGHAGAGVAAFTLGRIARDVLGEPERAARAFARVIELGRPASLIEDAHAALVDTLLRAGRRGDAEAALDAYQRAFPTSDGAAALRVKLSGP